MSAEQPPQPNNPSLITSCHCKRVQIKIPSKPTKLNECRCTVCYKYGAIWAYFTRADVIVSVAWDAKLESYLREDKSGDYSFNRCGHCGCMTHWKGEKEFGRPDRKMGVNCRLLPESEIGGIDREVDYSRN